MDELFIAYFIINLLILHHPWHIPLTSPLLPLQGIKPSSFDKIDDTQTRELIEWCTRLNSKERPTVKQLLNHEFFAEDCGMRLDVANREEAVSSSGSVIHLQLRVVDAKKRRDTHKENEAIQFNYVLNKDNPEETAKQMVRGRWGCLVGVMASLLTLRKKHHIVHDNVRLND